MTCIVGLAEGGRVYVGADSAGISGWDLAVRADKKVFKKGPLVMGFTSSFRMGQLLAHKLSVPTPTQDQEPFDFMVSNFVESARQCLKDGGFVKRDNDVESGGTFIVGYRGRVFSVEDDFQVSENALGFEAVGCGKAYALGSLWETRGEPGPERVMKALIAAHQFSAGVRPPFNIEEIG